MDWTKVKFHDTVAPVGVRFTGASAVCVAGVLTGRSERNVRIQLLGGDLDLEWNETDNHVYMTGPAEEVFQGEWPS